MSKKIKQQAQEKIQDLFGEVMKRVPITGELKLPKEVVHGVLANVEKARMGVLSVFSHEMEKVFSRVDVAKILTSIAKDYTLKINAELKLEPKYKVGKKKKT
jgi:hypothetical protein